ncbi:MAG: HAD family hydrolase [Vulcanimicrobiaceae bacterium]
MPAFIFDLDGTLVDSVYQHVLAWHAALRSCGFDLAVWRIHRKIGMSGGLLARSLMRELNRDVDTETAEKLRHRHAQEYLKHIGEIEPLPGARDLLRELTSMNVPWAIATSGALETAAPALEMLDLPGGVPIITRDQVKRAKPDPDLFLAAAEKLNVSATDAMVVGDSVWDMLASRRANFLGIGLLAGGYGQQELEQAGAFRVYADPDDMRRHLDELGLRQD